MRVTIDRFAPGFRVGDYKIVRPLGSEGFGVVYVASHVMLPRIAALAILHAGATRAHAVAMLRAACLLEALDHPGIPRVFETGVLPGSRPWTAFELVEGVSVGADLAIGPLPLVEVVLLVRDVAKILAYVHARGVVHRKLMADAIVRTPDREFPVRIRHWDEALTVDTEVRRAIDTRDDVHALGVIAHRALTGHLPDSAISTRDRCPAAPPELTGLIDHMLATDPTVRPGSDEVESRARWLAETLAPATVERTHWTPPVHHITSDVIPVIEDDGFAVRISRTQTRRGP